MPIGTYHGLAIIERALGAALARFQLALATGTPYYAHLYDAYQLSAIFGERELLAERDSEPSATVPIPSLE